ncbi:MAG: polysaccharide biosynthesis tyrosine autokinase [Kiritimatiellae bacterium]|nr:polysaccharide biosynthesis tyrosine autokinase [Kiritimatiellia bacterium]
MDPLLIWQILWRRKWIVIRACLVITVVAALGAQLLPRIYQAKAKVRYKSSEASLMFMSGIGLSLPPGAAPVETMQTRIALATSRPALERIAARMQTRNAQGVMVLPRARSGLIRKRLQAGPFIDLQVLSETDVIQIDGRAADADAAGMLANSVADSLIEVMREQAREEYKIAKVALEGQINTLKAAYLQASEELRNYKVSAGTVDMNNEMRVAVERMDTLMQNKHSAIIELAGIKSQMEILRQQVGAESADKVSSATLAENTQIRALKVTIYDLEMQLAGMLTEKTREHPDVQALTIRIAKAKDQLAIEVKRFQEAPGALQALERNAAAMETHLAGINTEIERQAAALSALPQKAFGESHLQIKLATSQNLYNAALAYLHQIGMAESMVTGDIRLIEEAQVPDAPKTKLAIYVMCMIMGILGGLVFGFLIDSADDTIKSAADVQARGLTVMGVVPFIRSRESRSIAGRESRDPVCEAYRAIRNQIDFARQAKPFKSLLIASAMAGEGKTVTAANLGVALARAMKNVLLVDANLRKPALHQVFDLPNAKGLTTLLTEQVPAAEVIQPTGIKGLSLLAGGPHSADPASLIESDRMRALLAELAGAYDVLVLDSPSFLNCHDAIMLAGYTDGVIIIGASGQTTDTALSQAAYILQQARIVPLGMILNKFRSGSGCILFGG